MPELPEVERFRQLLLPLVGHTVSFQPLAPHRGISGFDDTTVHQCHAVIRKGKQICLELSNERSCLLHMGMTGSIRVKGIRTNWGHSNNEDTTRTMALKHETDEAWPPRFAYLSITTTTSYDACFCDPRKFGKIQMVVSNSAALDELAPDCLDCHDITADAIVNRLAGQRLNVKALLMDQKRVVSGVGNWVADEVLYQTSIHPEQCYLTNSEAIRILNKLQEIVRIAVDALNRDTCYPKTWLFGYRWTKNKRNKKDFYNHPIQFCTVGGRTSAVIGTQKLEQRHMTPSPVVVSPPVVKPTNHKKRRTMEQEDLQQIRRRSPRLSSENNFYSRERERLK